MAEICCGIVNEKEASPSGEASSQAARRKRMEIRKVKFVAGVPTIVNDKGCKKARLSISPASFSRGYNYALQNSRFSERKPTSENDDRADVDKPTTSLVSTSSSPSGSRESIPKFGVASVCGRRREMEDAVAIHPSFIGNDDDQTSNLHYFGVYDGHGCSHVARRCEDRLHLLVKEEVISKKTESIEWMNTMERSFSQMDQEVTAWNQQAKIGDCRCELHSPESYGVGSTAVVAVVTPDNIIVANCGDSRAVLCRNGKAVPLSSDHKPDRPDELKRIEAAGGRVVYWEGARVCGVLAMSRAIGDNYLKPYVSCEPEVTITKRTGEDECLILASDGLWDVVSNETACGLAKMCLKGNAPSEEMNSPPMSADASSYENCDKACSDASLLLTKLALARQSMDNVSVVVVDLRANGSS
ncbi:probable protein phosphatase 2C 24 [Cynara cardunculus var. scolymus]|uniref:protein-serine/threonine phosphatase n=1 Tax=Cynara cardunculus var. scolymus TaxID=59895 RepID=A0A124SI89_CYNCS|nr:probable protein phosphatase 2C 24 [Cynara cardunculus var. scolymus]KVI11942.1 Protein phosphatase 2C [Cynara cardunculus var. scolymus]